MFTFFNRLSFSYLGGKLNLQRVQLSPYLGSPVFLSIQVRIRIFLHFVELQLICHFAIIPRRLRVGSFAYFIHKMSAINAEGCHHLNIITRLYREQLQSHTHTQPTIH